MPRFTSTNQPKNAPATASAAPGKEVVPKGAAPVLNTPKRRQLPKPSKIANDFTDGIHVCPFPLGGDEERFYKHYNSQEFAPAFIPLSEGEKVGKVSHPFITNGLRIDILKGRIVQVPYQIAEDITESFNATQAATDVQITNPYTGERKSANLAMRSEEGALTD